MLAVIPCSRWGRVGAGRWSGVGFLVLASALGGCVTPSDPGAADAEAPSVHAFLRVDRAADLGVDDTAAREHASATFLRTSDETDPHVLARLVGALPWLPAAGRCASLDADEPTVALHTLSPVELVEVGGVRVQASSGSVPLVARAYPDVAHLVSGVVYTTADATGLTGREGGEPLTFQVDAAGGVPDVRVQVDFPTPLRALRVGGVAVPTADGHAASCERCARGPFQIDWAGGDADEVIYVDAASEQAPGARLRCVAAAGEARVEIPAGASFTSGLNITVHRLKTVPFQAEGLTTGEVRLDTALSSRIALLPPS
jgi:hypothetical protein